MQEPLRLHLCHSSDAAILLVPSFPPKVKANDVGAVPAPILAFLLEDKLFCSDQLVPFHNSAFAVAGSPPITNASVEIPEVPCCCLAVFKFATSVQLDPFQSSVSPTVGGPPPEINAAVLFAECPLLPNFLPEFKSRYIQSKLDPFQDSAADFSSSSMSYHHQAIADSCIIPASMQNLVLQYLNLLLSVQPEPFHDSVIAF
jgi:hypothetical protein